MAPEGASVTAVGRPQGGRRVVVVIPAHNEERFIGSVVLGAREHGDAVIVVDDGSSDRTALVAKRAGAVLVAMDGQQGKAAALSAGFHQARQLAADVVVTLDGDAQHDTAEIPLVAAPVLAGEADVVVGSRFLGVRSRIPAWRRVGQTALTWMTNLASGTACTDSQSGYRALSPRALDVLRLRSGGLVAESEMQFACREAALRMVEVPIHAHYRDPKKRNPVTHGLQVVDGILGMVARRRPLAFFGLPGLGAVVGGFLLGLEVVRVTNDSGLVPLGTAILSTLLIVGGLLLAVTGVILNTLERYTEGLRTQMLDALGAAGSAPRVLVGASTAWSGRGSAGMDARGVS